MKNIALYIHIPFCKQKCRYCDFPSFAGKENFRRDYIDALVKEILKKAKDYLITTIFIGGGTPSYLNDEELEYLLSNIKKLNVDNDYEFTVECNPGTLNYKKLKIMKDNGVNRLSIGLQSSKDSFLKSLGRIHTFEEFKENLEVARKVGFNNINVDLMFGLPNQTLEIWIETLKEIISLNLDHISAYSLIIEEGTQFYKLYEDGKLNLPSEEEERMMYEEGLKVLKDAGYNQYEISNFSKENKECKHNLVYWNLDEYLGCGVSASSYINNKRYKNIDSIDEYIKKINLEESILENIKENSIEDDMEEFVFMGLRKIKGIKKEDFYKRFNKDIHTVYEKIILKHIKNGLLVEDQDYISLTSKGIELSNYVMSDFILT